MSEIGYVRAPKHDKRFARGDDYAGDAWRTPDNRERVSAAICSRCANIIQGHVRAFYIFLGDLKLISKAADLFIRLIQLMHLARIFAVPIIGSSPSFSHCLPRLARSPSLAHSFEKPLAFDRLDVAMHRAY